MKEVYEFNKDAETGGVINEIVGRICLFDGDVVRIIFGPQGVFVTVREESIKSGAVVIFGGSPLKVFGLGVIPDKDDEKRKDYFRAEGEALDESTY